MNFTRTLAAALIPVIAIACGGDGTTRPSSTDGIYTLRSLNGAAPPFVFSQSGADKYELLDDAFTLTIDGTYTESGHYRRTTGGQATVENKINTGTFTRNGTQITFGDGSVDNGSATLDGETLTLVQHDLYTTFTGIYTK